MEETKIQNSAKINELETKLSDYIEKYNIIEETTKTHETELLNDINNIKLEKDLIISEQEQKIKAEELQLTQVSESINPNDFLVCFSDCLSVCLFNCLFV